MIYSMLKKMDRWWYENNSSMACRTGWNQTRLRHTVLNFGQSESEPECSFLDVPVLKGFSDNFTERCIDFSVESISGRGLGTVNILPKGREKGGSSHVV